MPKIRFRDNVAVMILFVACGGGVATSTLGDEVVRPIEFNRDIRPILSDKCFRCHGPDSSKREGDLRLDVVEGATADLGGHVAISPRKPDESTVVKRIRSEDASERMPPPDSGLSLKPNEIDLIVRWIEQGAPYEAHWAFRLLTRPVIPNVTNPAISQTPVDRFVQEKLDPLNLEMSPEAQRGTLARRLHLDLVGLPPDAGVVQEFSNDERPDAYDRLVDRVLANPGYGERWGRHWLDQARYADTNGYTVDTERSIWPYRDWVIAALNQDMPFDQFTVEQLAGDLLPNPNRDQLVATGFHRNTLVNQEGGTDAEQFRNEAVVDRVNTTGAVWLGLTLGCAQCHNHKYDPVSQQDYYGIFAFFNSGQDVNNVTPTVRVATADQEQTLAKLDAQLAESKARLSAYEKSHKKAEATTEPKSTEITWSKIAIESAATNGGSEIRTLDDGSLLVGGANPDQDEYVVAWKGTLERITAIRLEALTHESLPKTGPGRAGNGNFVLGEIELQGSDGKAVKWGQATADHSQKNYDVKNAIDGNLKTGWAINGAAGGPNANRIAQFIVANPVPEATKQLWTVKLKFSGDPAGYNLGRFRLSITDAVIPVREAPDPEAEALAAAVKKAQDSRDQFEKSIPTTMVMRDLKSPRETNVLIRGDFLRKGDRVSPKTPAIWSTRLEGDANLSSATGTKTDTRLELARWLVDQRNPLVPRVIVNRMWMRFFGDGLVETENDFGMQGTPPTHPDLLDWLSWEFMNRGWSEKRLKREMVLSHAYRQSSKLRTETAVSDPRNKLLARQNRVRVEGEIVRDAALAVSGLLTMKIGGPSVHPPQPDGVYAFTQRAATWKESAGEDRFRRGLYTFFMRSAPYPMLTTFDTPRFDAVCTRRVRSNTPLQSLTLANDKSMIEFARALASRVLTEAANDDTERIDLAFRLCLSRPATESERNRLAEFLRGQRQAFQESTDDAIKLAGSPTHSTVPPHEFAAWTSVARVLINLDEFITRE